MAGGAFPLVGKAIAYEVDPHSVRFAATSPPIDGGEEELATRLGPFPLPHESGGEVAAKRTEWGIFRPMR